MTQNQEDINKNTTKVKRPWYHRVLKIMAWFFIVVLALFVTVVLVVRSPWGQMKIVDKATSYVSNKTHTKVTIGKLFITFTGDIELTHLYLEDKKQDTLLYSQHLKVEIPIWPIIMGNPISIDGLEWEGLTANVLREDSINGFNYQFLLDAFAGDTTAVPAAEKEEESKPLKISIGTVDFKDFRIKYYDAVVGINATLNLGSLHLKGKNIDLQNSKFEVARLELENTVASYVQEKPFPPSQEDTSTSKLPFLSLNDLIMNKVVLSYKSIPDSIDAFVDLKEMVLQVPKADLHLQEIQVNQFTLNNSKVKVKLGKKENLEQELQDSTAIAANKNPFPWPDWDVKVHAIAMHNNLLKYEVGEHLPSSKEFNPDHIVLSDFNLSAQDIALSRKETAHITLKNVSFKERSGIELRELGFVVKLNPQQLTVKNLVARAGNSSISSTMELKYVSLNNLLSKPEETHIMLDLKDFDIDLKDAFKIKPDLENNEYLHKLAKHNFAGQIKANGTLAQVNLPTFEVHWGPETEVTTQGNIENVTDIDKLVASMDNFTFRSTKGDISHFVKKEELGISIPQSLVVKAQLNGSLDNMKAAILLTIPEGNIKVNGQFSQQNKTAFNANVQVLDLNLGAILKNPAVGKVAFEMETSGEGNSLSNLTATVASTFSKLELNGYNYKALQLDGTINNGDGNVILKYKDSNLDLLVNSKVLLDSAVPMVTMDFNLEGADLFALRLTDEKIRAKLLFQASFKGNTDVFDLESHVTQGIAVYKGSNYHLGNLDLIASVTQDTIALDLKSKFLNGNLSANAGIDKVRSAVQNQLFHYFTDTITVIDTVAVPVKLVANFKFSETDLITQFLVPEIKSMDTLRINVNFNEKERTLLGTINLPHLNYDNNTVDSFQFHINSSIDNAEFKLGFNSIKAGPISMNRTFFDGDFKNELLNLHFHAMRGKEELYVIKSKISGKSSNLKVSIDPEELILNSEEWNVPIDNELHVKDKSIVAHNFILSHKEQSVSIGNDLEKVSGENIGIGFKNFQLSNLLALFNVETLLASGELQGNFIAVNPFGNIGLLANLDIDSLSALGTRLGKLSLKANALSTDKYNLNLDLKGEDMDVSIAGNYSTKEVNSALDFKLDLNKVGMKTIASLTGESLKEATGNISGEIVLKGSTSAPDYKGFVQFNDANFKVAMLNSKFLLTNDKIKIDNNTITLNQFSVQDEKKNTFTLDGSLATADLLDPTFDLKIRSKNFQALNSTEKDNEEFYGIVNFDMDGTIMGSMRAPIVNMNIEINKSTTFTYVLQNTQAELEKSDGVVKFVNKENPDDILTRDGDSSKKVLFGGIELHTRIKIDKGATFNIIIDPITEDQLNVTGSGDIQFNIGKNGLTTMNGRYDINKGNYSLSLYNLVKRDFELEPGSSIIWRGGSPIDADLNVTAKYYVQTSASALMASQISGASEQVKSKYQQRLPFLVYLNFKGGLDQPELSFNLGMPEESKGAIDGTVYSRIKQLNNEESALNKQVFSLLVLKKFYPNAGSDGSDGGAASIARKNINDALSDQLNSFSDKLTGNTGIELDFGLNSYTDYQSEETQQRTDLNISAQKRLFNDRLIVQVGSNVNVEGKSNPEEENPVVGNVSIQYLLTEDGRYRLKGFRNSEYENVIDGQVFVNGISLIFQRQFNKFKELRKAPAQEKEPEEENKEAPKKEKI